MEKMAIDLYTWTDTLVLLLHIKCLTTRWCYIIAFVNIFTQQRKKKYMRAEKEIAVNYPAYMEGF